MEPFHSCADLMLWLSDFFTSFLHVKRLYLDNALILIQFITGAPTPATLDNTGTGNGNPSDTSGLLG